MVERPPFMRRCLTRGPATVAVALLLGSTVVPARGQAPEVIVLDPNHPIIQNPGTIPPPAVGGAAPSVETAGAGVTPLQEGVNAREILAELWFKERALLQRGESV